MKKLTCTQLLWFMTRWEGNNRNSLDVSGVHSANTPSKLSNNSNNSQHNKLVLTNSGVKSNSTVEAIFTLSVAHNSNQQRENMSTDKFAFFFLYFSWSHTHLVNTLGLFYTKHYTILCCLLQFQQLKLEHAAFSCWNYILCVNLHYYFLACIWHIFRFFFYMTENTDMYFISNWIRWQCFNLSYESYRLLCEWW